MINTEDIRHPCRVQLQEGRSWRTLFRKRYRTVFDGRIVSWCIDTETTRITVEAGSRYLQNVSNKTVALGKETA